MKHVFGLWEEAGVSGENSHVHGENMQTLSILWRYFKVGYEKKTQLFAVNLFCV